MAQNEYSRAPLSDEHAAGGSEGLDHTRPYGENAGPFTLYTSNYAPLPTGTRDSGTTTLSGNLGAQVREFCGVGRQNGWRRYIYIGACVFLALLAAILGGALSLTSKQMAKEHAKFVSLTSSALPSSFFPTPSLASSPLTSSTTASSTGHTPLGAAIPTPSMYSTPTTSTASTSSTSNSASSVLATSPDRQSSYAPPPSNGGGGFLNGTVVNASSEHPAQHGLSYAAVLALDGDPSTFWNDNTEGEQPDVLTVISPVPIALAGVTLISVSDGWPTALHVETSVDGNKSWTTHATVTGNTLVNQTILFDETVVARGVRVNVTAVQDERRGVFTRIAELKPIVAPWPAGTTFSTLSSHAPSNAIDGDIATFWNDNNTHIWPYNFTITFPSTLSLSGVTLFSVTGPPTDLCVLTSPDGNTSWETQASINGNTAVQLDVHFNRTLVATRAVRVSVGNASELGQGAYSQIVALQPLAINWPVGTVASASSTNLPDGETFYNASNAIDRDLTTYWRDDTQDSWPDVLTLLLPSSISLSGVTIVSHVHGVIEDFLVETQDMLGTWTRHATAVGNAAIKIPVWFDTAVTCVGLRITVTAAQNGGLGLYTRIVEVIPGAN